MFKRVSAIALLLLATTQARKGPAPPDSPDKVASMW